MAIGSTEPRIWTKPNQDLTSATSLGFEAATWARGTLKVELLPWQEWWLIHALELHPGGGFRFRISLTLIGRQNGKTTLMAILALWLLATGRAKLVLGAAQSLDISREAWLRAIDMAEDADLPIQKVFYANGKEALVLRGGARYRVAASTRGAGRGLSVDGLILDELREQRDFSAWGALSKTVLARPDSLILAISNAGDRQSVVLKHLHETAMAGTDDRMALFEWSARPNCDLDDEDAWAQACPALGYTLTTEAIQSALSTDPPQIFRTEILCQSVDQIDGAINADAWAACADPSGSLIASRGKVTACVDVSPDGQHVTVAAAAVQADGRVRVETAGVWSSVQEARDALLELLSRVDAKAVGWYPSGPGAVLGADLAGVRGVRELKAGDITAACQGMAEQVISRRLVHGDDRLMTAHVIGAGRLPSGDGWRFTRQGDGHVDAAYAAAGAVFLARESAVSALGKPRVLVSR